MNKVQVIKELWRDLSKLDVEGCRKALAKSGWKERKFSVGVVGGTFYSHLYASKDGVEFYFFFGDDILKSITEN